MVTSEIRDKSRNDKIPKSAISSVFLHAAVTLWFNSKFKNEGDEDQRCSHQRSEISNQQSPYCFTTSRMGFSIPFNDGAGFNSSRTAISFLPVFSHSAGR